MLSKKKGFNTYFCSILKTNWIDSVLVYKYNNNNNHTDTMLLLSKLLMLTVARYGDVSQRVCIFNFETVSSLYRALYEVRLCIPNILDSIELHQAQGSPTETSQNMPSSIYWQV